MRELADVRKELDQVDQALVRLFEQRMNLSREVASIKIEKGMDVLDASREEQVLESRAAMLSDAYWTSSVQALYREIMRLSRQEQQTVMEAAHA